jgi:hypothetical protein
MFCAVRERVPPRALRNQKAFVYNPNRAFRLYDWQHLDIIELTSKPFFSQSECFFLSLLVFARQTLVCQSLRSLNEKAVVKVSNSSSL